MLQLPLQLRPEQEVPAPRQRLRRPGLERRARDLRAGRTSLTEYGFLVASFDFRGSSGRGKKAMDSIYLKLGVVEIDDQAAGVKSLYDRPYVDKDAGRDLRHVLRRLRLGPLPAAATPTCFTAASAQSAVTVLVPVRLDLHRALHVDPPGEQGRLRGRQRHDLRQEPQGPADALLRHGGQQRPSDQRHAAHPGPPGGRQELRGPGRARPGPHRRSTSDRMMEFFIENLMMKTVPLDK